MKKTLVLLLSMVFIGGCGSNFEWFPKYGGFNNSSKRPPYRLPHPAR